MRRLPGWEQRLMACVRRAMDRPFEWGEHDCALFAADCVEAITGEDLAEEFRGRYMDRKGSLKVLRACGEGDLQATVTRLLGEPSDPKTARRGDLVLVRTPTGPAIAVCVGLEAVAPGRHGLTRTPMGAWRLAWRV